MNTALQSKPIKNNSTKADLISSFDDVKKHTLSAHYKAMLFEWCDSLPHDIKLKKNFDTACWVFHHNKHHIYIGDLVYTGLNERANKKDYITAFVFHEMAHARWTSRNLKKILQLLKEANVDFELFNLFEDARIEHLWREATGYFFDWNSLMEPLSGVTEPVSIFYALIHTEGDFYEPELEHYERVVDYYDRAIQFGSCEGLISLLVEFIEEFKPNPDDIPKTGLPSSAGSGERDTQDGDGDGDQDGDNKPSDQNTGGFKADIEGDLKYALEVAQSDDIGDMDKGADTVSSTDALEDDSGDQQKPISNDLIQIGKPLGPSDIKEIQHNQQRSDLNHVLMLGDSQPFDSKDATEKAMAIKSIFMGAKRPFYTDRPSKRLNKRHFANPSKRMYVRKEVPGVKRFDLTLIIDCSGSMEDEPIKNARQIIATFNRLALMGVFKGRVILSSSYIDNYPILHLPLSDDDIGRVAETTGAEGLEKCMRKNVALLKKSDYIFVITDGNLADSPIEKMFYQSQGIYTIGLYACQHQTPADLTKWFDLGIVRKELDDLFSAMVNYMKQS